MNSEFEDSYEDQQLMRGAILTTPVSRLSLRDPIIVEASASVRSAVDAMNEHHVGCVLVRQADRLAGIFTERDVLTRVIYRPEVASAKVESVMTRDPETMEASATIAFALNMMSVGGYRHIPIVDKARRPVGVLSVRDIADFIVGLFPDAVLNLPPSPAPGIARSQDGG